MNCSLNKSNKMQVFNSLSITNRKNCSSETQSHHILFNIFYIFSEMVFFQIFSIGLFSNISYWTLFKYFLLGSCSLELLNIREDILRWDIKSKEMFTLLLGTPLPQFRQLGPLFPEVRNETFCRVIVY